MSRVYLRIELAPDPRPVKLIEQPGIKGVLNEGGLTALVDARAAKRRQRRVTRRHFRRLTWEEKMGRIVQK